MDTMPSRTFLGRTVSSSELQEIQEVTASCSGLSRTELAKTVCELLGWTRSSGGLKSRECHEFLGQLAEDGLIHLPPARRTRPLGSTTRIRAGHPEEDTVPLQGSIEEVGPVLLVAPKDRQERDLWRGLVERHHYLGWKVPYGASLNYFIKVSRPEPRIVGCMQFSSPAWRMAVRDQWIGWDDERRRRNLQRIVSNSRFLILPTVRVKNLASCVLSKASRLLPDDWEKQYGIRPFLLESLVDTSRFAGTCYRAANWIYVGQTSGRGRMDRDHARVGESPKAVFLWPLAKGFRSRLEA